MAHYSEAFVGIDVAKQKNALATAESGRNGEIRYVGEFEASDASMRRVIQCIAARFDHVHFCYEAGSTGYGHHRLSKSLGHDCIVVAPSLIPRKPGDRVKTRFQCQGPAVRGAKVCRMHGAKGGAPFGPRHGRYAHGAYGKDFRHSVKHGRDALRLLESLFKAI